jgi:hypothetical protein
MTGTRETDARRDAGAFNEGLAQAARLAVVLGAVAFLSLVGMAWASYLRGRPVEVLGDWLGGPPGAAPSLPDGAVIAVQGETCPYPWQDYPPAQGRFVLGAGSGAAMNLDANGVLVPVRSAGETGGQAGVELQLADIPPHTHRFALGKSVPGWSGGHGAVGVQNAPAVKIVVGTLAGEPSVGIVAPFAMKRGLGWRGYELVDALEPVGGVITSDRRFAARRHDSIPPFVALTICTYSPGTPIIAGAVE